MRRSIGADGWHIDGAYEKIPLKATQLYALAIPDIGGDTLFASGYAAYDAMPLRSRERLDGLSGTFTYGGRTGAQELLNPEDRDRPPAMHPLIRTAAPWLAFTLL
jgi:alpha-ketoglutarate-dependent taurine dioxygenase